MTTIADELKQYAPRRFNRVTKQRFRRDRWRRLCAHVGGAPDEVQKIRIGLIIDLEWTIVRLNARSDSGDLTEHATRQLLACHNHVRMLLAALGPATSLPEETLHDYLAAKAAGEVVEVPT